MAQVGTLTVDLIAQTASFNANIEKAAANLNSQTARMNRSVDSLQKNLAAMRAEAEGFALGAAIKGAAEFVKAQLDMVGGLGEVSQQLGVTTKDLQVYRYIGSQVGIEQEDMDKGLSKLTVSLGQAALGADKQSKVFAALGISVRDANGHVKTAGQVLPEIADRLSQVSAPAQRSAAEVALFGKAGQKLDTILTSGGKTIQDYGDRAEELGLVIKDNVIQQADTAADKISELNAQLSANIAGTVAQNAQAIYGLANSLVQATSAAVNFINNYPRLSAAIAGAALGGRFGLTGAAVGAGVGFVAGDQMSHLGDDTNVDLKFRAQRLQAAKEQRDTLRARAARPASKGTVRGVIGDLFTFRRVDDKIRPAGDLRQAQAEYERQAQLWNQAVRFSKATKTPLPAADGDLPSFIKGKAPKAAAAKKDPLADSAERFASEMDQLDGQILSARRDLVVNASDLATLERQQVAAEMDRRAIGIDKEAKDKHITAAQADELKARLNVLKSVELEVIDAHEAQRLAEDALSIRSAANDNERDLLQAQEQLATSAAERRRIQLRILDLEQQEERAKLEGVIASKESTDAEKKIAAARLAGLGKLYGARAEGVKQQTMGPGEAYLTQLRDQAANVNEAFQQIEVEGLRSLNDGIVDAITGARSLGEVFHNVANQIIADLVRMAVQKAITIPLANALGLGSGSSSGGGIFSAIGHLFGHANGTSGAGAGYAWVGERGPEIVKFRGGEQVIPNNRIQFGGGGGTSQVQVVPSPYFDVVVDGRIVRATPAIADGSARLAEGRSARMQSRRLAA